MFLASYNTQKYDGVDPQDAVPRERVSYKMDNKWGSSPTAWSARSPHWLYTCKPNKRKMRGLQTVSAIVQPDPDSHYMHSYETPSAMKLPILRW